MKNSILFFKYFFIFLIVIPIGTLLHEVGHYLGAILQGYNASISYAFTHLETSMSKEEYFLFTLAGPLSTWLLCLTGFIILQVTYRKDKEILKRLPRIVHTEGLCQEYQIL